MTSPANPRPPLEAQHFQVIVIGGGINGVAIARECARYGRRTLLLEEHDFGSGTTSRSTRIIHGGLRYLEHGEIDLVRESLRARGRLLREYPHLVHPMQFVLAWNSKGRRSAFAIRAGLWLYRRTGARNLGRSITEFEKKRLEQSLDAGHHWSLFNYEDAQCEFPERLVAEWLLDAKQAGAVVRNYTRVLAVNVAHGRVRGVLVRDQLTGKEEPVEGTWVINATGPWADRLLQRSSIKTKAPMVGGVRGSHIVLQHFPGTPGTALYTEAPDGRPFFVIPWNDQVLVGTTEVPDSSDPAKTAASPEEIEYLLGSVQRMFPRSGISAQHIRYAFAGVRPLPFSPGKALGAVSRRHFLHDHSEEGAAKMISVIGGKLTTAAELARACVQKIGIAPQGKSGMALVAGESMDPLLDHWVLQIADAGAVSESTARSIVEWHGKRAVDIARMALSSAELRAPLCPHTEHIVAEAVDAFSNECAVTLSDVLLRRVPVAWGSCWSDSCSREAAMRIAAALGWGEERTASELETVETERAALLRKVPRGRVNFEAAAD
ncbi:MAG TPA: glycerol-3-phosphate dehydrogenase/oxidase [Terriglobales bacterium]|nr:glycerol-3-phosphate dehydrogenase/oxidase [Terriglobales bacterium]